MANILVDMDIFSYLLDFLCYSSVLKLMLSNYNLYVLVTNSHFYRELITLKHSTNMLPLCYSKGLLNVLKKLKLGNYFYYYKGAEIECILNNQTGVLQWLGTLGLFNTNPSVVRTCVRIATMRGYLFVIQWCTTKGFVLCYSEIVLIAVKYTQIAILDWLYETVSFDTPMIEQCIITAASNNKLTILGWLHSRSLLPKDNRLAVNVAIAHSNVQVLDWFSSHQYPITYDCYSLHDAVADGYLDVFLWLEKARLPIPYTDLILTAQLAEANILVSWLGSKIADNL